jgi:hypothetical protein
VDDLSRIREVKRSAQSKLRAIPGVHAVGVGPKITQGKHTGQPSIVALMVKKMALTELSSDEVISAEIDGVKTDIQAVQAIRDRYGRCAEGRRFSRAAGWEAKGRSVLLPELQNPSRAFSRSRVSTWSATPRSPTLLI